MRKRVIIAVICLFCLMSQMIGMVPAEHRNDASAPLNGSGNYPPPAIGDWVINMPTYVGNETIDLRGNLSILTGATLTLRNVTLKLNCTADWQRYIEVLNGGTLKILDLDESNVTMTDASNITSTNPNFEFNFWVRPTATFEMRNSILTECGEFAGGVPEWEGLFIQTDNAIIDHCQIDNCSIGVALYGSDAVVSNNTIEWCDTGIRATTWSNGTIQDNIIKYSDDYGIWVDGWDNTVKRSSNPVIRNNQIYYSGRGGASTANAFQIVAYSHPLIIDNKILDCTEDGIYYGEGCSANIINTSFDCVGGNYGIASSNPQYVNITNCSVQNTALYDLSLSDAYFVVSNTSFNMSKVTFWNLNSNLTVQWFLNNYVNDTMGNSISGANLQILDNSNGTFDRNFTTNANGYLNWTVLREYFQKDINGDKDGNDPGERIDYSPYNISVSKEGFSTAYAMVWMTNSKSLTITLSDIQSPEIIHSPITSVDIDQPINITANVTDNAAVDTVYLNYTYVNGTNQNVSMNRWNGNWSFDIPGQGNIGVIDYFIWANDTSGNANMTGIYQIQIVDLKIPEINHVPVVSANVFTAINITANVTDDVTVNDVFLNYTGVSGTNYNVSMSEWNGNFSYDIPGQTSAGTVHYFIWANDTSDNGNKTLIYQILINDVTKPEINHVPVVSKNIGEIINITANMTDDVGVNKVFLNYTDVHSVNQNITMNKWDGNYSFEIPGQSNSGFVDYFIWANDSSDNDNITQTYQIQIFDITDPEINHVPITSANVSEAINITANITDDVSVSYVYLNWTGINGTSYNVSMQKWNGNYSYEIAGQSTVGYVSYFIWCNDSSGNDNKTTTYQIQIFDITKSKINHQPVTSANVSEAINITANITDDVAVGSVFLNYTGVNGTNYNVSMHRWNGNWSFEIPGQNNIGIVSYSIWVNDTSGNNNTTAIYSIKINDITKPIINHMPVISANIGDFINITVNVTDDAEVDFVYLNYTNVAGDNYNMSMNKYNSNWSYEITGQDEIGIVSYFIWANDTSGNDNRTVVYQIQVLDVTKPEIIHIPVLSKNISETINITATIIDDVEVNFVYLNYTDIDGINHNVSMNQWKGNWSYVISGQLSKGNLTYCVWANDTFGNANQTSVYQVHINEVIIPDTTSPTIISKSPTGVNVVVTTTIMITFNEPMNTTSAQNAITISPSITILSYNWNPDNTTLTITPSVNLSYNTTYNITVGISAKDITGNALENQYSWAFTTEVEEIITNGHDDNWLAEYWWIIVIIIIVTILTVYLFQKFRKDKEKKEEPEETQE